MRIGSRYFHKSLFVSRWDKKGPITLDPKFRIYIVPSLKARNFVLKGQEFEEVHCARPLQTAPEQVRKLVWDCGKRNKQLFCTLSVHFNLTCACASRARVLVFALSLLLSYSVLSSFFEQLLEIVHVFTFRHRRIRWVTTHHDVSGPNHGTWPRMPAHRPANATTRIRTRFLQSIFNGIILCTHSIENHYYHVPSHLNTQIDWTVTGRSYVISTGRKYYRVHSCK